MASLMQQGFDVSELRGRPRSIRVRRIREGLIYASLVGCALFSVLITFAIIFVLFRETMGFFGTHPDATQAGGSVRVTVWEFLTGTEWTPLLGAEHHYGVLPLVVGTLLVAGVAALIAIPLGLVTAVFLSEYASARLRAFLKPTLEVLAGIPTVVYGFFALTVITPSLRAAGVWFTSSSFGEWFGRVTGWYSEPTPVFEVYNAAGAGVAVGIMCLPIVCSLSEDAIRATPRALREGAYAVGGTKFDVSVKVVIPAALSGVVAAFLLAIARAVGETMAVSLAAGGLANLTMNPAEPVQTMTAWIVQIFLGDASNFGPEYRSAYAVAAVLFLMTLGLTILGNRVLKRYREVYQ
jgi:phosphate transport system permease protein